MRISKHYFSIFLIIILLISACLPSVIKRRARANVVSSIIFSESFDAVNEPDIGDQLTKEGDRNFWGTVRSGEENILWTDYQNIPYLNDVSNAIVSKNLDLSSPYITSASLDFNVSCDTEPRAGEWNDYVQIMAIKNGQPAELARYDETALGDENYHQESLDLLNYLSSNFQFKFVWNTNNTNNEHMGCSFWPIKVNITENFPFLSGSLKINNGVNVTNSENVTLQPSSDRAVLMSFSNNGEIWSDWIDYSSELNWKITDSYGGNSSDGEKKVYAKYKDAYGEISADVIVGEIILDRVPPDPKILLNSDIKTTTSKIVSLYITFIDQSSEISMRLSNDAQNWSNWLSFEPNYQWDLTKEEFGGSADFGSKTVYLQLKDGTGNISPIINGSVDYETTTANSTTSSINNPPATVEQNNPFDLAVVPKQAVIEIEPIQQSNQAENSSSPKSAKIKNSKIDQSGQNSNIKNPPPKEPTSIVIATTNTSPADQEDSPKSTKIPFTVIVSAFPLSVYFKSYRKLSKQKKMPNQETELDQEILAIQGSTTTAFDVFRRAHNYCRSWKWYYTWHLNPEYFKSHFVILVLYVLLVIVKVFIS